METAPTRLQQLLAFYEEDPADPFTVYAIATEYRSAGNQPQAWLYYQELLNKHPDYVGTYYHAGKLLAEQGDAQHAEQVYRKGLLVARKAGQMHAASELQGALNQLLGLDYEDD
ncbi:tetratricopeptide repeat protein [Hymenobacter busanensis]|uniref:Tetratricopeptide repeat protein n=1 Tax=Hymenobacter busanensis TaxID=2607656 RepID=A0A7L4ZUG9_9BACT|nr:tetratricopeptide repeat protein [Hymenobacter busanensis]KAA9339409.1 tetratricopeptide repeat protein [Hymenobacter busanensis]QHJ06831.1 tetratricopeptide repeat protein [Hymenobacter busanensis]